MDNILGLPFWNAVFWGVITFSLLVFLHEGGHFLAARLFGVKVHEFMLGLPGPALRFKSKKSCTAFGVTVIPLGGYVRIAGMEPGAEDELLARALQVSAEAGRIDSTHLSQALDVPIERASSLLVTLADYMAIEPATDDKVSYLAQVSPQPGESADDFLGRVRSGTYRGKKTWQRIVMLVSGVVVNIASALLVFTVVLAAWGYPTPSLTIETVVPDTAAEAIGLRAGDVVTAVDGTELESWDTMLEILRAKKPGDTVTIAYERDGQVRTASAELGESEGRAFLGVGPKMDYNGMSVIRAVRESIRLTGLVFVAIVQFFANIVRPTEFAASLKDARSVIGISQMAAEAAKAGPLDYAWLVALLSLSLGAMNILPIPPLDGGKVAVEIIERAAGHPLRREVSLAISATGALLLFSLIGYLMYADIARSLGQ